MKTKCALCDTVTVICFRVDAPAPPVCWDCVKILVRMYEDFIAIRPQK